MGFEPTLEVSEMTNTSIESPVLSSLETSLEAKLSDRAPTSQVSISQVSTSQTSTSQVPIAQVSIPQAPMAPKKIVEQESAVLCLPSDFLKTPNTPYQPDYYSFSLTQPLWQNLRTLDEQKTINIQALLLAALQALLYRYTQQETLHLGVMFPSDKLEGGYAGEICSSLNTELSSRELVNQMSMPLKSALNSDFNSEPGLRSQSTSPVAVTFIESNSQTEEEKLWVEKLRQQHDRSSLNLDLHLWILQGENNLSGVFKYNTSLFKADTIQRLANHFQVLLEGMVANLDCPIAQLPLLTFAEEQQLLVDWHSGLADYPQIPIYQHIEAHAAAQPTAIALAFKDQQLTYTELNQRANQLAHYLNQIGVGAETPVAVCLEPSLDVAISLLGILKAGGVYVPLEPTYPLERLSAILADTKPQIVLTQTHLLPNLPAIDVPQFCFDRDGKTLQSLPIQNPDHSIDLDQTAYVVYTSGTTGKPKGVMASHRNLIHYILVAQKKYGFDHHMVMPAIARFTFSITFFELLSPLVAGGKLVILEREHILDFKRLTQTLTNVNVIHASPSLLKKLLAYIKDNGLDTDQFRHFKHVSSGGDMVSADLLETIKQVFATAEIYVIYGCSEVSCMGCTYPALRDRTITKSWVGKPFPNVSVRLYDPCQNLVPIGVVGEIYISGAGVTKGYLNREELTQEKFVEVNGQRFYRTGDLGRLNAEGDLEILGRSDFQIQLRGIRIELGEIETTLRQVPGVREGIVVARELGRSEKSLVAYVVLDPAPNPSIEEIRRFLQAKLPDYMVPTVFVVLEAMPLNVNQKVDRRALPLPTVENMGSSGTFLAPRNVQEQELAEIWETVLGIQPIGVRNSFFELGGDSLLAVQMLLEVEKRWGKNLPITILLQVSTIEELVAVIHGSQELVGSGDVVPLRKGTKPPLFCMYGVLIYRELAEYLPVDQSVYGVYLQEEVELLKTGQFDQLDSKFSSIPNIATHYLKAVRATHPHGPYYLAGESIGGVIAYEMAQQLKAAGEEVPLVVLFDSWVADFHSRLPIAQRLKLHWKQLSKQGFSYLLNKIPETGEKLRQQVLSRFYQIFQKADSAIESIPDDVRELVREQAIESYIPDPYDGRVLLLRAGDRDDFEMGDRSLGWGELVEDLHIFDIPGDHLGILKSPNVQLMADKLTVYLNGEVIE
jgi:amino acid adenylation domain-containing protein